MPYMVVLVVEEVLDVDFGKYIERFFETGEQP
jgi:hypothetical protein